MRQRQKCRAHRTNGEPCNGWAIHGGVVCTAHGGRAPQVKRAAQARMEAAADPIVAELIKIVLDDSGKREDKDRIKAGLEILDRAGYTVVKKSEHEVSVTQAGPGPDIRDAILAERAKRRAAQGVPELH